MRQGKVIDLDKGLVVEAAEVAAALTLPMAVAIMYTTARLEVATLWTQDVEFRHLEGVKFIPAGGTP